MIITSFFSTTKKLAFRPGPIASLFWLVMYIIYYSQKEKIKN
jgi:hypothetical protein